MSDKQFPEDKQCKRLRPNNTWRVLSSVHACRDSRSQKSKCLLFTTWLEGEQNFLPVLWAKLKTKQNKRTQLYFEKVSSELANCNYLFLPAFFLQVLNTDHITGERKISLFQMKSNAHIKQLKYVKDKQIPEDKQC